MTFQRITGASGALSDHPEWSERILEVTHIQRMGGSMCGVAATHEMKKDMPLRVTCEICYGMYLNELFCDGVLTLEEAQAAFRERFMPDSWEYIERKIEDDVG